MTITVNTPDGGTAQFPDGTDTSTITSAMKAKFGGPDSKSLTDDSVMGQIGNTAYRAANTGTLHALDYGLAALHAGERATGYDPNATDLSQIRAENEDFATKHPLEALGGDILGYTAGLGKLGLAGRVAEGAAGLGASARVAQGIGGAVEGAGLSGIGTLTGGGSVSDAAKAAVLGGGIGGAAGAVLGAGASPTVGKSLGELQADQKAAFNTMDNIKTGNVAPGQAVNSARNSLSPGQESGLSTKMKSQLDSTQDLIANNPKGMTVTDLYSYRKNINNAVQSKEDTIVAKRVGDALYNLAPQEMGAASLASGRVKDMEMLMSATPEEAVAAATKNVGPKSNAVMDTAGRDAMTALSKSGPGMAKQALGGLTSFGINHGVGYAGGALVGHPDIGGLLGLGNIGNKTAKYLMNAKTRRSIQAAKAALSGQPANESMYGIGPWAGYLGGKVAIGAGLGGDY